MANRVNVGKLISRFLTCLCLSLFIVVTTDIFYIDFHNEIILILLKTLILDILLMVLAYGADRLERLMVIPVKSNINPADFTRSNMITLFFAWIIYVVILFPGILDVDALYSINDFFDGTKSFFYYEGGYEVMASINAHHPILVTLLAGLFVTIGIVLGNPLLGIFIWVLTQIFLFSYLIVTLSKQFLEKNHLYRPVRFCIIYMAFSPLFVNMVIYAGKNSIYTIALLMYVYVYIQMFSDSQRAWKYKDFLMFFLISLFVALSNKTGVFTVIFCDLALVIKKGVIERQKWVVGILCSSISTFLICIILLPKIIYPICDVFPGGKQEMLGPMFMQTACVVADHENELSDEEKMIIDRVVSYPGIRIGYWAYEGKYTQEVKNKINPNFTNEEFNAYIMLWLKHLFKYPKSYLKGILGPCGGFFSISDRGFLDLSFYLFPEKDQYPYIHESNFVGKFRKIFNDALEKIASVPGVNFFFYGVTYTVFIPAYTFVGLIRKKRWNDCGICFPFIINLLFLFVCPTDTTRYAFPLICLCPFLIMNYLKLEIVKEKND